jgi:hypothetical protein
MRLNFEAQQAVRWWLPQPDGRLEANELAIAELMWQHVLWEIERDVFFLSDAFSKGYDFRGAPSGGHETRWSCATYGGSSF